MRSATLHACFFVVTAALAGCGSTRTVPDGGGGGGMDSGPRDSSVPACSTMGPEDTVAACSDSCDNEDDGFADCEDFGCCAVRTDCPATSSCGMRGDAGPPRDAQVAPACEMMLPAEDNAEVCSNGCDDDGNRFADCDDFDCCDFVTCGPDTACGRRMPTDAGVPMQCPGAVEPENTLAACSDGCNNDDDGTFDGGGARLFVDCADRDCCSARTDCPMGTYCGDLMRRDAGPAPMACTGPTAPEDTIAACSDGCNNDGDRFVDCEDRDCCDVRSDCAAGTYCGDLGSSACSGPTAPENTVAACGDSCSNDGDAYVDCDDRDCCTVRSDCPATTYCGRTM